MRAIDGDPPNVALRQVAAPRRPATRTSRRVVCVGRRGQIGGRARSGVTVLGLRPGAAGAERGGVELEAEACGRARLSVVKDTVGRGPRGGKRIWGRAGRRDMSRPGAVVNESVPTRQKRARTVPARPRARAREPRRGGGKQMQATLQKPLHRGRSRLRPRCSTGHKTLEPRTHRARGASVWSRLVRSAAPRRAGS